MFALPSSGGRAPRAGRDDALDGIRALAIVSVVVFHLSERRLPGGWIGVDIFFVLSGFLITGLVTREIDASGWLNLGRFYQRRVMRLWPAFALMFVATLGLAHARPAMGLTNAGALYAAGFMTNWSIALGWTEVGPLGHCWSLAVEQQFYLLWPPVLMVLPARRRLAVTGLLTVAAIAWRHWMLAHGASIARVYDGLDTHADGLLIGAILSWVDRGAAAAPVSHGGRRLLAVASTLIVVLGVIACLFTTRAQLTQATLGFAATSLGSAALIACARRPGWLRHVLTWRPLVGTGRLSYGIYLWHFPLLVFGRTYLHGIAQIVPVAASVVVASLSYRFVEQPFLRSRSRTRAVPTAAPMPVPALGAGPA